MPQINNPAILPQTTYNYVKLAEPWIHGNVPTGALMNSEFYQRYLVQTHTVETRVFLADNASFNQNTWTIQLKKVSLRPEHVSVEFAGSSVNDQLLLDPVTTATGSTSVDDANGNLMPLYEWFNEWELKYQNDSGQITTPMLHRYFKWCHLSNEQWLRESYGDFEMSVESRRDLFERDNYVVGIMRLYNVERLLGDFKASLVAYNTNSFQVVFRVKPFEQIYYGTIASNTPGVGSRQCFDILSSTTTTNVPSSGGPFQETTAMYVPSETIEHSRPDVSYFRIRITGRQITDREAMLDRGLLMQGINTVDIEPYQISFDFQDPENIDSLNLIITGCYGRVVGILIDVIPEQNYRPENGIASRVGFDIPGRYIKEPVRDAGRDATAVIGKSQNLYQICGNDIPLLLLKSGLIGQFNPGFRPLYNMSANYEMTGMTWDVEPVSFRSIPLLWFPFSTQPILAKSGLEYGYLNVNGDLRVRLRNITKYIQSVRMAEVKTAFTNDTEKSIRVAINVLQVKNYHLTLTNLVKTLLYHGTPGST